eukprot:237240-Amphidinium_carterae.1
MGRVSLSLAHQHFAGNGAPSQVPKSCLNLGKVHNQHQLYGHKSQRKQKPQLIAWVAKSQSGGGWLT